MVKLKNKYIRVPYILPFVYPKSKCWVIDPINFSIDIWKTNLQILKDNDTIDKYKNLEWLTSLWFNKNTRLKDVCKYYIKVLKNI